MTPKGRRFPLFLDLTGRRILIVGGGPVATRRARSLSPHGRVEVVSAGFTPALLRMKNIRRTRRRLSPGDAPGLVRGAFLVIPATDDPLLNEAVARAAHRAGAMVNRVDGGPSDVMFPAVVRRGGVTVAISTGGASPAVARHLRRALERSLGPEVARMVESQMKLRRGLQGTVKDSGERRRMLRRALQREQG